MNNKKTVIMILVISLVIAADPVLARDLGAAANNAVSAAKTVTRALSIFGVLAGCALMQIPGLADFGQRTMGAGLVGGLCAFGGPTLIKFFEGIFGGL